MLGLNRFSRSRELEALRDELGLQKAQIEILRGVIADLDIDHLQIIAMRDALARVRGLATRWRMAAVRTCNLRPRERTERNDGYAEAQFDLSEELLAALTPASKEFT